MADLRSNIQEQIQSMTGKSLSAGQGQDPGVRRYRKSKTLNHSKRVGGRAWRLFMNPRGRLRSHSSSDSAPRAPSSLQKVLSMDWGGRR